MRKQSGIFARFTPIFDSLEERSLLSAGLAGSAGFGHPLGYSPVSGWHSESAISTNSGLGGGGWSHGGWAGSPGEPWSSPPGGSQDQPGGNQPTPMAEGATPQPAVDVQSPLGPPPNPEIPSTVPAAPGAEVPATGRSPNVTTEPEADSPVQFNATFAGNVAGLAGNGGKDASQEPGGAVNTPGNGGAPIPPGQVLAVVDAAIRHWEGTRSAAWSRAGV
jgi:hypothetical protein